MSESTPTKASTRGISPTVAKQALQTLYGAARHYRGTADEHGAIQNAAQLLGHFIDDAAPPAVEEKSPREEPMPGPMATHEPNRHERRADEARRRHKKAKAVPA